MKKFDKYCKVNYEDNEYIVCELNYGSKKAPVILDVDTFNKIKQLDKFWKVNDKGIVTTQIKSDDTVRDVALHDVVMRIIDKDYFNRENNTILHINKLGIDNRAENLMYDVTEKNIKKNLKKKKRTILLPEDTFITPEEIPSYVWYIKEDATHGDRFVVNIGDINWKSTSSKKLSLRYKLEETKKYMRYLKDVRSDLFEEYSMNGDLNDKGNSLIDSFIKISQTAGYNINYSSVDKNTDNYLKENLANLSTEEKMYLDIFNPRVGRLNFKF